MSTVLHSEASVQAIPCDLSSTISTGSFLTSETLDASPIDTGKCWGFVIFVNEILCSQPYFYSRMDPADWT